MLKNIYKKQYCKYLHGFDLDAAAETAKIIASLEKEGSLIWVEDEMIAGICLAHNAAIISNNSGHFAKIEGLKVINY